MKPLRGKRVDPQSRPSELSSARGSGALRFGILATRPRCFAGPRRVHFPRAERHDRFRGGYKPAGEGRRERQRSRCYSPGGRQPPAGPRNDRVRPYVATRPSGGVRLVGTGQPCPPTAPPRRPGLAGVTRFWVSGDIVGLPPDPS